MENREPITIAFVTGNARKFAEAQHEIPQLTQLALDLPEIQELDSRKIIAAKVEAARANYTGALMVDDVSLELLALNGFPGPLIKWLLASNGNEGVWKIASSLGDTRARAICTLGYAVGDEVQYFVGVVEGKIIAPRGPGTGWDPVFVPTGETKTYGEMTLAEKNAQSHRGIALAKLKEYLHAHE